MDVLKKVLIDKLADIVADTLGIAKDIALSHLKSTKTSISSPYAGSLWLTYVDGNWLSSSGQMCSAYYHPTKKHTATTIGKLGTKRSEAEAG